MSDSAVGPTSSSTSLEVPGSHIRGHPGGRILTVPSTTTLPVVGWGFHLRFSDNRSMSVNHGKASRDTTIKWHYLLSLSPSVEVRDTRTLSTNRWTSPRTVSSKNDVLSKNPWEGRVVKWKWKKNRIKMERDFCPLLIDGEKSHLCKL